MTRIGSLKVSREGKMVTIGVYKSANGKLVHRVPNGAYRILSPSQLERYTLLRPSKTPNTNRTRQRAAFEKRRYSQTNNPVSNPTKTQKVICVKGRRMAFLNVIRKWAGQESYDDSKHQGIRELCQFAYGLLMRQGFTQTEVKKHLLEGKPLPNIKLVQISEA